MKTKKLIELAYSFYPKGICFIKQRNEYINSIEFKKLTNRIDFHMISNNNVLFDELINELKKNDKLKNLKDVSLLNWHDRCFSYECSINKGSILDTISLNLSILIPFYSLKILDNEIDPITYQWNTNPKHNLNLEKNEYKELILQIELIVERVLNYKKFPEVFESENINDISFQDIRFGDFNLYKAFFLNIMKI